MATVKKIHVPPSTLQEIVIDVTPNNSGIEDLTTVAASKMRVLPPTGTPVDLSVAVTNKTATTLRLTHQFTDADVGDEGNFIASGSYAIWGLLTVTGYTPVEVGPFFFTGVAPSESLK